ncbi:MocR-like pyridoxine biosynthesis transcription factor PdxR [Planococcus lenghuensis]|uniref:GntR family transcriptional regulator n=1 Tax=Planococcus lenghuensis TaxID=2213202 RepID=A0A1Q2KV62_9BACL|nr:PLP-dependent aminotransferase family protein [Planococcus lenghuensis]AQQ51687.1 GntR family transcriptional regulator [Planococcus lenghuensis]
MEMLMVELNRNAAEPLYEQLYTGIRNAILQRKIAVGDKLPSKRKLADYLSISRTTVEQAYDQLLAEGYIEALPRQGFYAKSVEELAVEYQRNQVPVMPAVPDRLADFSPGKVDTNSFPFSLWRKLMREVLDDSNTSLLESGHPQGDWEFRNEIAAYLYQSRGVNCTPEQIVIGSGTEQLLPLLIRLLAPSSIFAFEDPGYPLTHTVFAHYDRSAVPIPVDGEGLLVQKLHESAANITYVTPSHQFPTGAVMSAARRTQLLKWAAGHPDRFIIEDDYDSEFRYIGRPVPSLQSMDRNGRVIYLSTFSKSLMPSLRIAYMVLPLPLLEAYRETFLLYSSTVPRTDQQLVTLFMKKGHFQRHLNRIRTIYRHKRELLTASLTAFSPYVSVSGDQAGMHIVLTVKNGFTEQELVSRARSKGIHITGLETFRVAGQPIGNPQILIGFGGLAEEEIVCQIEKLMASWSIKKKTAHC